MNIKGTYLKNIEKGIGSKLILISFITMILGNLFLKSYRLPVAINVLLFFIISLAFIFEFFINKAINDRFISTFMGSVCIFLVFYFWFFCILSNSKIINYRNDILFKSVQPRPIKIELKKISTEDIMFMKQPFDKDKLKLEKPKYHVIFENIFYK